MANSTLGMSSSLKADGWTDFDLIFIIYKYKGGSRGGAKGALTPAVIWLAP